MPVAGPVLVSALVDLDRPFSSSRTKRARSIADFLELAPSVLSVPLPMVVFTELDLIDELMDCRQNAVPNIPTVVVPFVPHDEWDDDVHLLSQWLKQRRPLCSSNVVKDTPEYLALGWSKVHCLRRAADLLDGDWYWWIDIGIGHTSAIPSSLTQQIEELSLSAEVLSCLSRPGHQPTVHLVSLEHEGWHADPRNIGLTRRLAQESSREWWLGGAQLVAGGVIGIADCALDGMVRELRTAIDDAAVHEAAVTDEMLLTRWLVNNPSSVTLHPGRYSSLFDALQPDNRPHIDELCPSARFIRLPDPERPDRAALNPSIAADPDGGYRVIVRHANYRYVGGEYQPLDGSNQIITDNVLMRLDEHFHVVSSVPIDDSRARVNPPLFPVLGLEDMRLFQHDGKWMASATSREHRNDGLCQIVVVEFDTQEPARVASSFRLPVMRRGRPEKNWAPVFPGGAQTSLPLTFLWSALPPRLVAVDEAINALKVDRAPASDFRGIPVRGGSQVISVDGGWLTVVHRVETKRGGWRRVYEHQVIFYDGNFLVRKVSPWFVFATEGIEFCAGMAVDDTGVVLSFGFEDRQAWLVHFVWDDLWALLDGECDEGRR